MSQSNNFLFSSPLSKLPICLIGNLNIDLIIRNVPHLPSWGQEVLGNQHVQVSSGQAGYTAFALRGLQVPVSIIGNVGADLYGQQIIDDLQIKGVDIGGCEVTPGGQTGITVAIVREDGERAFVSNIGCLRDFTEANVRRHSAKVEAAGFVGLLGLFNLPGITLSIAARILSEIRTVGKITMLDTGWDPENWLPSTVDDFRFLLKGVTLFMPNWDEARAISRCDTVQAAGRMLLDQGPEIVVIKCGAEGSYACTRKEQASLPALPTTVYDAVGAGDTFNAGFLTALREGWELKACLALGNAAAALYISRSTNRFPELAEVISAAQPYGLIPIKML